MFAAQASVGALWDSLPELLGLLAISEARNSRPLMLFPESPGAGNVRLQTDPGHVYAKVVGYQGASSQLLEELGRNFPSSSGGQP